MPARLAPAVLALAALPALAAPAAAQEKVPPDHAERMARGRETFARQVRPFLVENCLKCHGGEKVRGGLDLATRESLLKGGDNGPAIVPYSAKDSRLYRLASHLDEPHMPYPKGTEKLPAEPLARLAAWIDDGAPYDQPLVNRAAPKKPMVVTDEDRTFWAFQPLKRPTLPLVRNSAGVRNPVDSFLLAKLEEKGLTPNGPADRRTLIRRVTFDLTGLPPTPEEVDAFVKDDAPDAYEKVVNRLLASPHYGERWARHWLDLARFAESHGFEHDYDRPTAYHYRDFVIKAFNQDLPYNKFVRWQIAGDEYEPNNPLALSATGFLGAGVHSTQITVNQVEKERYDELDDIVRTTGTAFLGLTVGCARCHDHKYDPIPTRDYYRMVATFTTTVRTEVDLNFDADAYAAAKARFDAEHAKVVEPLSRYEKEELPAKFERWLADGRKTAAPRWVTLDPVSAKSQGGATLTNQPDNSVLATGKNPPHDQFTIVAHTRLKNITAVRLEALAHDSLVKGGPGRASNGNFALSNFTVRAAPLDGKGTPVVLKLKDPKATFEQHGLPVAAAIDADGTSAWAIDPQFGKDHAATFELETPAGFEGGTVLTFDLEFRNNTGHGIARPRLAISTAAPPAALDGDVMPQQVLDVLTALDAKPEEKPTEEQRKVLLSWFRTQDAGWRELNRQVEEHAKTAPKPNTVKALICSEGLPAVRLHTQGGDFLPETHFLKRGDPNQKDGVATQGFLQVLTRHPDGEKHWQTAPPPGWRTSYRRRALAEWLTDVEHGSGHLLARVIVNRLWQHHFGTGLVGTPSDFGNQGERPSHPELLDYLACELIDSGWSLKHVHRLIVTSAAYRRGTAHDAKRAALDPDNRLLWRMVPRRLEAEAVRDSLLAVSGTLDTRMFGPGTLDPTMKRRSIYFFVKRSQLVPMMTLFDAPDALQGIEQRTTTTIAPQALLLMNNALVRRCADDLALRVGRGEKTPAEAVQAAYVLALGRPPAEEELNDAVAFLKEQEESYRKAGKGEPRHRALTDFCQVLLGLNEFVYID
jgi:mono/diheme cytochrome c family protein